MSTSTPSTTLSPRAKKVICPKVWKRPHSTIYGKNVEFGSSLYSDKIGELNGRKFNSELPWTARNSGSSSSSLGHQYNQGYLSNLLLIDDKLDLKVKKRIALSEPSSYEKLLDITNPSRYSSSNRYLFATGAREPSCWSLDATSHSATKAKDAKIDFYKQYVDDFEHNIDCFNAKANYMIQSEPKLCGSGSGNDALNFDPEMGLFLPSNCVASSSKRSLLVNRDYDNYEPIVRRKLDINGGYSTKPTTATTTSISTFTPMTTTTTNFGPNKTSKLDSSLYGPSADGRKLSLTSINPQSYRPSLPQKTSTVSASDGEEFEFQDRSSPFYTDRQVLNLLLREAFHHTIDLKANIPNLIAPHPCLHGTQHRYNHVADLVDI